VERGQPWHGVVAAWQGTARHCVARLGSQGEASQAKARLGRA
jgi:hypothetical protein